MKTTRPRSPAEEKLPAAGNQRQVFDLSFLTLWPHREERASPLSQTET